MNRAMERITSRLLPWLQFEHMKNRCIAFLTLFLAASASLASMSVSIPFKELYLSSKTAAVVEVVGGQIVSAGGETCGARYKARVLHPLKNADVGSTVEFGYVPSLKVGGTYLVLLADYDSVPLEHVPNFLDRCRAALPSSSVLAQLRGALEVIGDTNSLAKREGWTVRAPKYVIFPVGTRTTVVDGERQFWFSDLMKRTLGQ